MTTQSNDTAVQTSIEVDAPPERAFRVFTAEMASWWPTEHHIFDGELAGIVVEPRAGGRIYDVGTDGREQAWARVLAYEPPDRFTFSWDISLQWQIETDPERTSEVEIRFLPLDGGRTRVELEHRHLDRHGDGWESMRDAVASPDGWGKGLGALAAVLAS